jgi:hypothetical protein
MNSQNISTIPRYCRRHRRTRLEFVELSDGFQTFKCPKCNQEQTALIMPDDQWQESLFGEPEVSKERR